MLGCKVKNILLKNVRKKLGLRVYKSNKKRNILIDEANVASQNLTTNRPGDVRR